MQRKYRILVAELAVLAISVPVVKLGGHVPWIANALTRDKALVSMPQPWFAWAGWAIFSIYWEIAKKNAAAATRSESPASRGVHVLLTNLALLLTVAPIRGLGRYMPYLSSVMWIGAVIVAAGLFLAIWSRIHLGRNWSGEITIKVDHQLIRSGPYNLLRHPIYTGLLMMYLGMALVTGTWFALIGVLMAIAAYIRKIRLEEANMAVAFGTQYDQYRRESSALVPGIY